MAETGWIKLHRKVLDCWIWQVKPYDKARAWVDLLLLVMHHDKKMVVEDKPITIERGSYFISRGKLAERWGWSIKKVDAYLKTLENEKMVTTTRTRKGTIVTVVNYEEYQIEGTTEDTTEDTSLDISQDTPYGTPQDTSQGTQNKNIKNNKELKNNKKEINKEKSSSSPDFEKAWNNTFDLYPKKTAAVNAKTIWMRKILDVIEENREEVAILIYKATKLYLANYKENNSQDKEMRYIPKYSVWLVEDCDYWIGEVEKAERVTEKC